MRITWAEVRGRRAPASCILDVMRIVAFPRDDGTLRLQAAELLMEAFPHENGWPTIKDALEEVDDALVPERRCCAAMT